jgi:CyaY protein
MTETEFNQLVDEVIIQVEDALDELESDIDYESAAGILTITLENQSQIIINRQISAMQLWLAARSGGYHFNYTDDDSWTEERSGEAFSDVLNRCLTEQSGEPIALELQ